MNLGEIERRPISVLVHTSPPVGRFCGRIPGSVAGFWASCSIYMLGRDSDICPMDRGCYCLGSGDHHPDEPTTRDGLIVTHHSIEIE
jgi:hypothetical protein